MAICELLNGLQQNENRCSYRMDCDPKCVLATYLKAAYSQFTEDVAPTKMGSAKVQIWRYQAHMFNTVYTTGDNDVIDLSKTIIISHHDVHCQIHRHIVLVRYIVWWPELLYIFDHCQIKACCSIKQRRFGENLCDVKSGLHTAAYRLWLYNQQRFLLCDLARIIAQLLFELEWYTQ